MSYTSVSLRMSSLQVTKSGRISRKPEVYTEESTMDVYLANLKRECCRKKASKKKKATPLPKSKPKDSKRFVYKM